MKPFAAIVILFSCMLFVLPSLTAQNKDDDKKAEKKDAKDDKKADEKKGDEKKDTKKDDAPKKTGGKSKSIDPEEEKILTETYKITARVAKMDANSAGEFTVQLGQPHPAKVMAAQQWYKQQIQQKTFTYESLNQYKMKMAQASEVDVRTAANMKVRTMFLPVEYDAKGNMKRWSSKEIAALKGTSKLPGFPSQADAIRSGQIVDLYVAKEPKKTANKDSKNNKKKAAIDDDFDDTTIRLDVLMIVVRIEAPAR
jgi:hypothetical protein